MIKILYKCPVCGKETTTSIIKSPTIAFHIRELMPENWELLFEDGQFKIICSDCRESNERKQE